MIYSAKKSYGPLFGLIVGFITFVFVIWGINYSLEASDVILKVLLYLPTFLFLGMFVIIIIGALNLKYKLTDESLIIDFFVKKVEIKFEDINEIIHIKGKSNLFPVMGVSWTGFIIGLYQIKGIGAARMYGTNYEDEIVYIKTNKGFYGITPDDLTIVSEISEKLEKEIEIINMQDLPVERKGKSLNDDRFYKLTYKLNLGFLIAFALYLAIFYPLADDPPRIIILLLVLAIAMFFFNIGNAGRLYQFSQQGSYILLVIGIAVTGIFLILSFAQLSL